MSENGEKTTVRGVIDTVEDGTIAGWVYDSAAPNKHIEFLVELDGEIACRATADQLRSDLKQLGFGNGEHGYRVVASTASFSSVRLLDSNQNLIAEKEVKPKNRLVVELEKAERFEFAIKLVLNCKFEYQNAKMSLLQGSSVVQMQTQSCSKGRNELVIAIPASLMTGSWHQLSVEMKASEGTSVVWSSLEFINSLATQKSSGLSDEYESNLIQAVRSRSLAAASRQLSTSAEVSSYLLGVNQLLSFSDEQIILPPAPKPEKTITLPVIIRSASVASTKKTIASLLLNGVEYDFAINVLLGEGQDNDSGSISEVFPNVRLHQQSDTSECIASVVEQNTAEFVLFVESGGEAEFETLTRLHSALASDKSIGAVGAKALTTSGAVIHAGGRILNDGKRGLLGKGASGEDPSFNYHHEVDFVPADCLLVRVKALSELIDRGIDTDIWDHQGVRIALQMKEAGFTTWMHGGAKIYLSECSSREHAKQDATLSAVQGLYHLIRNNPSQHTSAYWLKDKCTRTAVVVDHSTPKVNQDAGSYAAIQEIKLLQALDFKVVFIPRDMQYQHDYTHALQAMGVEVVYAPFFHNFEAAVAYHAEHASLLYVTRVDVAESLISAIDAAKIQLPVVFNNADLHFLRELRSGLYLKDQNAVQQSLTTRERELKVMQRVDLVLTYSDTEKAVITSHLLEQDKVQIAPWVLSQKAAGPSFEDRDGLAFLGGFDHRPNVEAMEFYIREVMPLLKERAPHIKLRVYGSNIPESLSSQASDSLEFVGFVEELDEVFHQCRLFIAPLVSGAGVKGKVMESVAYGVPSVLSSIAAEGTPLSEPSTTLRANTPEEWVEKILSLYDNETQWAKMSTELLKLSSAQYSFQRGLLKMRDIINKLGLVTPKIN